MKIKIELTEEEWLALQAIAIREGREPRKIVQMFVSDLTGSLRSNGSDERDRAGEWLNRTMLFRPKPMTPREDERMHRLFSQSYRVRMAEQHKRLGEQLKKENP